MTFEHWLDQGYGKCLLKGGVQRQILEAVLHHDHGTRAEFISGVIMPNHVHLLFRPMYPIKVAAPKLEEHWRKANRQRLALAAKLPRYGPA